MVCRSWRHAQEHSTSADRPGQLADVEYGLLPKKLGAFLESPHDEDHNLLGSILGRWSFGNSCIMHLHVEFAMLPFPHAELAGFIANRILMPYINEVESIGPLAFV